MAIYQKTSKCRIPLSAGAVAARMRVHDSGVCLVAAHLSSGQAEGDELRRNYDYAEARARLAGDLPCACVPDYYGASCVRGQYELSWPCIVRHGPRRRPCRSRGLCRGIGKRVSDMHPASY